MSSSEQQERAGHHLTKAEKTVAEPDSAGRQIESQSFLVRVWREAGDAAGEYFWRGHVTRVGSEERKYVQSFEEMVRFIAGFLPAMGVRLNWRWRTRLWLQKHKQHSRTSK